ncbi:MAG: hypothetical protein ACI81P_001810 [Neolewinella sp.]|jgi:hypothetical protein
MNENDKRPSALVLAAVLLFNRSYHAPLKTAYFAVLPSKKDLITSLQIVNR